MKTIALTIFFLGVLGAQAGDTKSWDRKAAAAYLDGRMTWWESWAPAVRDHDTYCVSCHTSLTYALARPALRTVLAEKAPVAAETKFIDNISRRVALWNDLQPYYNDAKSGAGKSDESRGTEVVLNALVLARYQAPATLDALREMFALQLKTGDQRGAWTWMNFHNQPWEAEDSAFWGASLAGLAAGWAPAHSLEGAEFQSSVALLGGYLEREQAHQAPIHRAVALWAASQLPQLLTPAARATIAADLVARQRPDGGWSAASLVVKDWKRKDDTPLDAASDGYGTSLMVLALEQSNLASAKAAVAKGRGWLEQHQDPSGAWLSTSLNKQRDPASDVGRFMNDAATAYAVMALSGK